MSSPVIKQIEQISSPVKMQTVQVSSVNLTQKIGQVSWLIRTRCPYVDIEHCCVTSCSVDVSIRGGGSDCCLFSCSGRFPCLNLCQCHNVYYSSVGTNLWLIIYIKNLCFRLLPWNEYWFLILVFFFARCTRWTSRRRFGTHSGSRNVVGKFTSHTVQKP